MSHVVSIKTELKDLKAVKAACAELGFTFNENAKTWRWYGRWVNDYDKEDAAYKLGIKPEDYGKCDHSISIPGCGYDIGLMLNPETKGYRIVFDFYGSEGGKLRKAVGSTGEKLIQYYGIHKTTTLAQSRGHSVNRVAGKDGKVHLTVSGKL